MPDIHNERRFQKKLRDIVRKYIVLVALVCTALFVAGQFAVLMVSNQTNAVRHLEQLEESLLFFDSQSRDFLDQRETLDTARGIILENSREATERMQSAFWQFGERCGISSEILIINREQEILYTSFSERRLSSYLVNYNSAICYNAKNTDTDDVYRAVYYDQGDYADVLYVKPVRAGGEIAGYVSVFLSGSSWNFYLSEGNFDGVITDLRNNAMYVSKPGLLGGGNKFFCGRGGVWHSETGRYWVASKYLPQQSAVIYSLVYYPPNDGIWVGILILLAVSVAWYWIAMWISRTMAAKNAASVETLVEEIHLVREDPESGGVRRPQGGGADYRPDRYPPVQRGHLPAGGPPPGGYGVSVSVPEHPGLPVWGAAALAGGPGPGVRRVPCAQAADSAHCGKQHQIRLSEENGAEHLHCGTGGGRRAAHQCIGRRGRDGAGKGPCAGGKAGLSRQPLPLHRPV